MNGEGNSHQWRFFRAGGFDQVQLDSSADLLKLRTLDQKLWVALACPVDGVEMDRRTLDLMDTDRDGYIRPPELLEAIDWAAERLTTTDVLLHGVDSLPLSAISESSPAGEKMRECATLVLGSLGKPDADAITLDDVTDTDRIFAGTPFNGDGIITALSTDNDNVQQWIRDIVACFGGAWDRSGDEGIGTEQVERFDQESAALLSWVQEGKTVPLPAARLPERYLPVWNDVKGKIDDFFIRCSLAAYDARAVPALNPSEERFQALAPKNLAEEGEEIAGLPLAAVNPRGVLPLAEGVNPAWRAKLDMFRQEIVFPLLGDIVELSAGQWETVKETCAAAEVWWEARPVTPLSDLPTPRLEEWAASGVAAQLRSLIERDLETAYEALADVEKLIRLCRDLYTLANNFVSFRDFYTRRGKGIFQAGTLYLDGRSYELCVQVKDVAKHAVLATFGRAYIVYCDCVRSGSGEKMTVAAAVTNGDSDHLMSGRNGIFYDRKGNDWNATIVRIIDHPISLRQAFWAPYKRIGRMVGEQIQKMAAARSKAAEEKATASIMEAGQKKGEQKSQQQQLFDAGKFAGIFAAIGLAIGAIGTAIVSVVTGFLRLAWWQMPLAILGVLLIISGPSMIIALFKLHQRNLAPILDATGWAVNARAKLNIPFGAALTELPKLPAGAQQTLTDPYAEKPLPWKMWGVLLLLIMLLVVGWKLGIIPSLMAPGR